VPADGPSISPDDALRRRMLEEAGARGGEVDELLAYNSGAVERRRVPQLPGFPLQDEPHIEAWRGYAEEAARRGAWATLHERLPQLRFPVAAGMSEREAYRAATRKGAPADGSGDATGLPVREPGGIELDLHAAIAGAVPVVAVSAREDFVLLVQALCHRNEPRPVPDSMGACIVTGYNNWDRVHAHRRRWEAAHPGAGAADWSEEFARLQADKRLYQDRFVILSRGPYSNVGAAEAGFPEREWLERSFAIRREHECTHYFTLRVFGALGNNLHEELLADFMGLVGAFGRFRTELALRFLGLESFPALRAGGRIENYRGTPPLSAGAFAALAWLANRGVGNLGRLAEARPQALEGRDDLARLVCALTSLTLEELAADGLAARVDARTASWSGGSR
jgi:hypothetical protein